MTRPPQRLIKALVDARILLSSGSEQNATHPARASARAGELDARQGDRRRQCRVLPHPRRCRGAAPALGEEQQEARPAHPQGRAARRGREHRQALSRRAWRARARLHRRLRQARAAAAAPGRRHRRGDGRAGRGRHRCRHPRLAGRADAPAQFRRRQRAGHRHRPRLARRRRHARPRLARRSSSRSARRSTARSPNCRTIEQLLGMQATMFEEFASTHEAEGEQAAAAEKHGEEPRN